jgi:Mrp family chromosome partitioning ATPase/capsular polysaccharide biosynthesis protein
MEPNPALPARVDPRAYLRPVWARKWLILLILVAATGATYYHYERQPKVYEASTQIFVQTSAVDQVLGGSVTYVDNARVTANQAKLIATRQVAESVASKLGFRGDPGALLGDLETTSAEDTDFVTITTRANSPGDAAARANAFAEAFGEVRSSSNRERLQQALGQARAELSSLPRGEEAAAARDEALSRVRQLEAVTQLPSGGAQVTDEALPPGAPIEPHPVKNAVFAFFLALLFSIGLVFLIELFDRRIKTIEDIDSTYPFPILAVVPHDSDPAPIEDGELVFGKSLREAFRSLRTSIGLTSLDHETKMIIVTSAVAGEGKSTVVRNLALAYAEAGLRVKVVETDLRRPTLAPLFGVERRPGLTDVLSKSASIDDALQHVPIQKTLRELASIDGGTSEDGSLTEIDDGGLRVLVSGPQPPNPPGVLAAERMHNLLDDLAAGSDVVLIDSPPLLAVSDAVPLLSRADAVVLVARLNRTTEAAGKRVVEIVRMIPDAHVAGIVVNDVQSGRLSETGFSYYYYPPANED